jgi:hypothetical protein
LSSYQQSMGTGALHPGQYWTDDRAQSYHIPLTSSITWRSCFRSFNALRRDLSTLCVRSGYYVTLLVSFYVITWKLEWQKMMVNECSNTYTCVILYLVDYFCRKYNMVNIFQRLLLADLRSILYTAITLLGLWRQWSFRILEIILTCFKMHF